LIFIGSRLIIPNDKHLRKNLFRLTHDNLGHFGTDKSYDTLRNDFYWPNMRHDPVNTYVPSCIECQCNKGLTSKPAGPLHPLPIPNKRFESVAIDFVGPLPKDDSFNTIVTMTDRLGADIQITPCNSNITAEEFATIFFDKWFCENGCPWELITDRDKLFVSRFWKALMTLLGIKHKMSTAFHLQTDGSSEHLNKTVIQALRFHVERNQTGWVRALPKVRFNIMNTVNAAMGFSPFALKSRHSPHLIPPLVNALTPDLGTETQAAAATLTSDGEDTTHAMMEQLTNDLLEARDSLTVAKISQAHHANKERAPNHEFEVGDRVLLATAHRRWDYMQKKDSHMAKFMPRFDGPFEVMTAFPEASMYTLRLPDSSRTH
jgi:hypothetical protein